MGARPIRGSDFKRGRGRRTADREAMLCDATVGFWKGVGFRSLPENVVVGAEMNRGLDHRHRMGVGGRVGREGGSVVGSRFGVRGLMGSAAASRMGLVLFRGDLTV